MMSRGQEVGIATQGGTARFVIVTIGQRLFAIDAIAVQGIVAPAEAADSLAPEFQGDVYPVIDLTSRLATRDGQGQQSDQVVLLLLDRTRGSVGVECVHGRMDLHESQILPLPRHFQGAERDWYRGMILFENSIVLILNLPWVLHGAPNVSYNGHRIGPRSMSTAGPELPRSEC